MRRLVYILLLMVVAGTVGCHRTPSDVERQLIDIDSLISSTENSVSYGRGCSPADSALKLLAALSPSPNSQLADSSEPSESSGTSGNSESSGNSVESSPSKLEGARGSVSATDEASAGSVSATDEASPGSVSATDEASPGSVSASKGTSPGDITKGKVASPVPMTEAERAYHALLTAQAMWKAYIPATTDSVIRCAWQYYEHNGAYDRRIRAMLYMGTTAEELGHPEEAMRWYKRTELEAKDKDLFYHGTALLYMAYLYQFQYISPNKAIAKHKEAYDKFLRCENKHYQLVCLTELGMIYRLTKADSAIYYSNLAINLARQINDTIQLYKNYESRAGYYLELNNWRMALKYSMLVVNSDWANENEACYYFAAQSYIHLGLKDSAWAVFNMAPSPNAARDSVLYYRTLSELQYQEGKYKESAANSEKAGDVSGNAVITQSKINYTNIENEFAFQLLSESNKELSYHLKWLWVLLVLVLFVFTCFINVEFDKFNDQTIIDKGKLSKANNEIKYLSGKLEELHHDLSHSTINDDKYKELFNIQSSCVKIIFKSTIYSGVKGASIFKYIFDIQKIKNKLLVNIKLPEYFWEELNKYLELLFPNAIRNIAEEGIILSEKEKRLISLDCLQVPNAVSAIILDYAEYSTASIRNRLIAKLGGSGKTLPQIMKDKSDKT